IEWLAGAMSGHEIEREIDARIALSESVSGPAKEQLTGTVAILRKVHGAQKAEPFVQGLSQATRLVNLEISPPGCDPRRRAEALEQVDGALGEEAAIDALALGAWSMLAAGEVEEALEAFTKVTSRRGEDIASWEGLRAAAEAAEQPET